MTINIHFERVDVNFHLGTSEQQEEWQAVILAMTEDYQILKNIVLDAIRHRDKVRRDKIEPQQHDMATADGMENAA